MSKQNRLLAYLLIGFGVGVVMHQWLLSPGVHISVRGENIPEINYIWIIRSLMEQGYAFTTWNPKFLGGEAVLTHAIYPVYWLMAAFSWILDIPVEEIYKWSIYALLWLSSVALCEFVWRFSANVAAGVVAGLIFGLMPGRFNAIESLYLQMSWSLVPLVLWLYERELASRPRPSFPGSIRFGLAAGLLAWSSIQVPLMMLPVLLSYFLVREYQTVVRRDLAGAERTVWTVARLWVDQRARSWVIAGLIASGIAANYYLPTLLYFGELGFSRYTSDPSGVTIPLSFIAYMLPFRWSPEFHPGRFHHLTWYIGGVAVILALVGILARHRKLTVIFWTLVAVGALLLITGDTVGSIPNPIYRGYDMIPLLRGALRRSFRFILPFSLALAILAAYGTAALTSWKPRGRRWMSIATLLLALFVVIDYWPHHGSFRTLDSYLREDEVALVAWLKEQDPEYRYLMPFDYSLDAQGYLQGYNSSFLHHLVPQQGVWEDSYVSHFSSRRANELLAIVNVDHPLWQPEYGPHHSAIFTISAVRYWILYLDSHPNLSLYESAVAQGAPVVFSQGKIRVLLNTEAKPLVQFFPYAALYTGSGGVEEISAWLPVLLAQRTVLVEPADRRNHDLQDQVDYLLDGSELSANRVIKAGDGEVYLEWSAQPTAIMINVDTEESGVLMVANAWFPGWQATVDGKEQPLLRAYHAWQAVSVPAGSHLVTLNYRLPYGIVIALLVSAVTVLFAISVLIYSAISRQGAETGS
jgi:hypothetical protein